ncbi:hypothetical protein FACS189490_04430 [Clostridia bacterium]|nr:hypothetical protein FACS189490_04430 [Clostridia bacterium]
MLRRVLSKVKFNMKFAAKCVIRKNYRHVRKVIHAFIRSQNTCSGRAIKKALVQKLSFSHMNDSIENFTVSYQAKSLRKVKDAKIGTPLSQNEPILICHVRDDLSRIKMQTDYHRKNGIRHFVYIDNMSSDGTFEYLKSLDYVSLYQTDEKYIAARAVSWRRQIMDIYGYDSWYLCLDSDELFCYPGIEQKPIPKFIDTLSERNIRVVNAFMLDMYSRDSLFSSDESDILKSYCYFDTDYTLETKSMGYSIHGGSRFRFFTKDINGNELHKCPLAKVSKDMFIDIHHVFPVRYAFDSTLISVLLHYKFLSGDKQRYDRIINEANYFNGSIEYKKIFEKINGESELTFYNERSQKAENSNDLLKIQIIDRDFYGM